MWNNCLALFGNHCVKIFTMKIYNFYCVICGAEIKSKKKHARTCSTVCRVALSNIMRYGTEDEEITKEESEDVKERVAEVKGEAPKESLIQRVKKRNKDDKTT